MEITFNSIKDINKEKIGLCIASGPSLDPYLNIIAKIAKGERKKHVLFSVNEIDNWYSFKSDFRIFANNVLKISNNFIFFQKNRKTKIVYADSVDLTPKWLCRVLLYKIDFIPYDQRHFNFEPCNPFRKCCLNIKVGRLTIQEELKASCNYSEKYGTGHTVAVHMLATAILSGCKEIYLFGVDLNYKLGYANNNIYNSSSFDQYLEEIIDDFDIINKSAKNIGVKIYSCSIHSPLNKILPFKEFDENS